LEVQCLHCIPLKIFVRGARTHFFLFLDFYVIIEIMNFNKNNYLKINSGAKPSCFVVDLKQNLIKKNVEENIDLGKSAKIDYKKYFRTKKEKIKNFIQVLISKNKIFDFYSNSFKKKILLPKSAGKTDKFLRKLDQLAFVGLGKLICAIFQNFFILFYKTCHQVGWTTLFLIRFIYFVLALLLKLIARTVKALIIFIGKIIFYSVVELRKINYKFWTAIVRSWRAIKQKIYFKAAIINKTFEQKKFLISRSVKAFVNIFKINKINSNRQLSVKNFLPRLNLIHLKPVGIFALILLIFVLPFQANIYYKSLNSIRAQVLGEGGQAISQFLSAGQSAVDLDFNQAQLNFTQASDNFSSAQTKLSEINGLLLTLTAIAPDKNLRLAAIGKRILQAGELSADIGKNLSLAINPSFSLYKEGGLSLKEILDNFRLYGRLSADQALELNNLLNAINKNDLQDKYSQQFILLKEKTAILANSLNKLINLADKTDSFLGAASDKRYLLVFQNNTEMRASGGFIGSYALVDFSNCKLKNIEAPGGGSYDVEAGMLDKIIAPHPLQLIAPQWYFWDANWWADWPTSANKLMWFY